MLGGKGAEHPIEDDQHAAVIAVEVFRVGGVVDAVVRRRVENPFERAELRDPVGMEPELVEQVEVQRRRTQRAGGKPSQISGTKNAPMPTSRPVQPKR